MGDFYVFGHKIMKKVKKNLEKICRIKKSAYLCNPFERKR